MKKESSESFIVEYLDDNPASRTVAQQVSHAVISKIAVDDDLANSLLKTYSLIGEDKEAGSRAKLYLEGLIKAPDGRCPPLYRLAYILFSEGGSLDGYLAEYIYQWAMQCGLSEQDVTIIFINYLKLKI